MTKSVGLFKQIGKELLLSGRKLSKNPKYIIDFSTSFIASRTYWIFNKIWLKFLPNLSDILSVYFGKEGRN